MSQARIPGTESTIAIKPTMHALKCFDLAKLYDQLGGGLPGVGDTTMHNCVTSKFLKTFIQKNLRLSLVVESSTRSAKHEF
jgi:hypothetical protein